MIMPPRVKCFDEEKANKLLKDCPKLVRDYVKLLKQYNERYKELLGEAINKLRK